MNPSGGQRHLYEPDTEKAMQSYEKNLGMAKNFCFFLKKKPAAGGGGFAEAQSRYKKAGG